MILKESNGVTVNKTQRNSFIVLFMFMVISCNYKSPINNTDNKIKMEENQVIKELFKLNSYKEPSYSEYRMICIKYLGIDIDTIKDDDFIIFQEYLLNKKNCYLKTFQESVFYQPDREKETQSAEETAQYLMKTGMGEQMVAFNQLIFRNSIAALPYFRENYSDAFDVTIWFDYEERDSLLQNIVQAFKFPESIDLEDLQHLLFYNNRERGFKKRVIDLIFKQSENLDNIEYVTSNFYKLQYAFRNNYYKLEIAEEVKDSCYIYIVEKLISYDTKTEERKSELAQYLGYGAIFNFCFQYGLGFIDRLKKNDYYGNEKIQEYSNIYMKMKDIETASIQLHPSLFVLRARVEDKDGFANIRKEPSLDSEVIGTVADKEIVTVLNRNGNMWYIKNLDGKEGYVHKSRLNAYYQNIDD